MRPNLGLVSGHRFSDAVSPPKPVAPLGAGCRNATFPTVFQPPFTERTPRGEPSANLFLMTTDRKEPAYLFSEKQVAEKSGLARNFLDTRTRLNENVDKADNFLVKRFYNLDHNTYLEGAVPAKYKELMGLVASACLRCDDCINYHVIQSYRLGLTRAEQEEAINVALVVGGSIVIPHMRRAYELLTELYSA